MATILVTTVATMAVEVTVPDFIDVDKTALAEASRQEVIHSMHHAAEGQNLIHAEATVIVSDVSDRASVTSPTKGEPTQ